MLKCSDPKKYYDRFFKLMKVPEMHQEVTEKIIERGRVTRAPNGHVIEKVVDAIVKNIWFYSYKYHVTPK